MLSKFKRNKHQQHLAQLPKISQSVDDVDFFYAPADFRETLLEKIASAKQRICIVALYLEQDDGGKGILNALYEAKRQRPELDVRVLVDWHRAQRGRIGAAASNTNADWYCRMAQENPGVDVPVYGVPINTREALGVLHFKGFIIDDSVLYSGASLNDVYLHQHDKYRYDRYHLIRNRKMSDIMFEWVTQNIMNGRGVNRLDDVNRPKSPEIKNDIRLFRQELRDAAYHFQGDADNDQQRQRRVQFVQPRGMDIAKQRPDQILPDQDHRRHRKALGRRVPRPPRAKGRPAPGRRPETSLGAPLHAGLRRCRPGHRRRGRRCICRAGRDPATGIPGVRGRGLAQRAARRG